MIADSDVHFLGFSMSPTKDGLASICAIHTRLGGNQDNLGSDNGEAANFFCPRLARDGVSLGCCRSWSIAARAAGFQRGDNNSVHIFALPLGWKANVSLDENTDDDNEHCLVPFYLSCRLVLPSPYRVKEIAFYGDDGNSSLSTGTDSGSTGQEGRQAMGLLVWCPVTEDNATLTAEELWLVQYDQAVYHRVSLPVGAGRDSLAELDERSLTDESVISVQPLRERQDDDNDERGVIYAKCTSHSSSLFMHKPELTPFIPLLS